MAPVLPRNSSLRNPSSHGEAFPGLIDLSWSTFQREDEKGFDLIFRAHEVAHQWWGIGVDFKTYHDQWLSEAFAEYSGLLYLQAVLKDNDRFFKWLETYRKEIMGNRKSIFGSGKQAGPIWLGGRTSGFETSDDYDLIIYKKGAWVLHMLRNLLQDPMTLRDDKFFAIMKNFYETYNGQDAGTEDFQRVVEKQVGVNLKWFFDQWVYGSDIPSYKFAYTSHDTLVADTATKSTKKMYQVTCRIRQENVPDDFRMYVPIRVLFKDDKMVRTRTLVQGPVTTYTLPLLPEEPQELVLNDLQSVLCDVENIDWNERSH